MKRTLLYLAGLFILLAPTAHAQRSFGLAGGVSMPSGNFPGDYPTGWHVLATLRFDKPAWPFALRIDGMVNRFEGQPVAQGTNIRAAEHHISTLNGNLLYPVSAGRIEPYLIGGAGYYSQDGGIANHNLGLNAGVGLRVPFGTRSMFVEARYHNFLAADLSHAPQPPARLVPISLGITF